MHLNRMTEAFRELERQHYKATLRNDVEDQPAINQLTDADVHRAVERSQSLGKITEIGPGSYLWNKDRLIDCGEADQLESFVLYAGPSCNGEGIRQL